MNRLLLVILFLPLQLLSQNIVPNPSFEEHQCMSWPWPPTWFQASGWFNPNIASPDLWSTINIPDCGINYIYNPDLINAGEWQWPHSGEKYLGMYHIYETSCTRDYVEARLLEPLNAGQTYCVEMYLSLSNRSKFCTDCIGLAFSEDSLVNFNTSCELGLNFAVMNDGGIICDTVQWQLVSGEYQAMGGEQFILIGNMNSNEDCLLQPTSGSKPTWSQAGYYFIDDVLVQACTISSSTSLEQQKSTLVFPNPFTDYFRIEAQETGIHYHLYSTSGKLILEGTTNEYSYKVNSAQIPPGVYLLKLNSRLREEAQVVVKTQD